MAIGRGDVGKYAAIIFCAGYVGYGDRTVLDEQKERLARLLRRASLGVAARFHLRRVYAADTDVHPHGMAWPDDGFGKESVAVENFNHDRFNRAAEKLGRRRR